ncbi:hypothetical protein Ac2012v2_003943 [Leucoagaricus gongylophorus]
MLFSTIVSLLPVLVAANPHIVLNDQSIIADNAFSDIKVPVQLGVMSKCPDALLCEATFNNVLAQVWDKVDLSLVYIAKFNNSAPDFGLTCLHGPEECAGNVQQLCVNKYATQEQWWNFVQCQNFDGRATIGTPELALKCADVAQVDWRTSGAGNCAGLDGSGKAPEGLELLHKSVRLGQSLQIIKSCTILINSRKVCVHDVIWKECEDGHTVNDFIRQINKEYARLNTIVY